MTVQQDDLIRVQYGFQYTVGGPLLLNTMHFQSLDAAPVINSVALTELGLVGEIIYNHIVGVQGDELLYTSYDVKNVTQDQPIGDAVWPTLVAGTGANPIAAPQNVGLIIIPTETARTSGRVNVAGLMNVNLVDGVWTSNPLAALANMGAELLTTFSQAVGRYKYVVLNRALLTRSIPTGVKVIAASRTQRRRSIGFGT